MGILWLVRDETSLKKGLISVFQRLLEDVEVIVSDGNYQDLVNIYDLEAFYLQLNRNPNGTRGSHQRVTLKIQIF